MAATWTASRTAKATDMWRLERDETLRLTPGRNGIVARAQCGTVVVTQAGDPEEAPKAEEPAPETEAAPAKPEAQEAAKLEPKQDARPPDAEEPAPKRIYHDRMDDVRFKQLDDTSRVGIAPGFVAITRTSNLREALARMIRTRGTIFAALRGTMLIGYAADVPTAPLANGGEWSRRWGSLRNVREGAIEVARGYRGMGIARRLLTEVTSAPRLDDAILIGESLVWHWDLEGEGRSANGYRARLLALFCAAGFRLYETDDPEISSSVHNFLVARIGPRVSDNSRRAFEAALFARRRA